MNNMNNIFWNQLPQHYYLNQMNNFNLYYQNINGCNINNYIKNGYNNNQFNSKYYYLKESNTIEARNNNSINNMNLMKQLYKIKIINEKNQLTKIKELNATNNDLYNKYNLNNKNQMYNNTNKYMNNNNINHNPKFEELQIENNIINNYNNNNFINNNYINHNPKFDELQIEKNINKNYDKYFYSQEKNNEKQNIDNNKYHNYNNEKYENSTLVALNNLGATCFMNAVLQILNNIKQFSEYLCRINIDRLKCPISAALKDVFVNLRNPNYKNYSPKEFKATIGNSNHTFLKNEPNDSRLLFQYILNSIHKELNIYKNRNYPYDDKAEPTNWRDKFIYEQQSFNYENKSIITDLFYGMQANETFCQNCKKISYIFDFFNILTLPILPRDNTKIIHIEDMLIDYSRYIPLKGKNKNFCLLCKGDYDAYCRNILYKMPEILIIHPGRKNKGIKYDIKIGFKEILKVKLSENLNNNNILIYNLIGIIYHLGIEGYTGHNKAYCKINKIWYEFNDNLISQIDLNSISGEGILFLIYQNK